MSEPAPSEGAKRDGMGMEDVMEDVNGMIAGEESSLKGINKFNLYYSLHPVRDWHAIVRKELMSKR